MPIVSIMTLLVMGMHRERDSQSILWVNDFSFCSHFLPHEAWAVHAHVAEMSCGSLATDTCSQLSVGTGNELCALNQVQVHLHIMNTLYILADVHTCTMRHPRSQSAMCLLDFGTQCSYPWAASASSCVCSECCVGTTTSNGRMLCIMYGLMK